MPRAFAPHSKISAQQLDAGGSVELTRNGCFEGRAPHPRFWIASRAAKKGLRCFFGFTLPRTNAASSEDALTEAMEAVVDEAAEMEGCRTAVVTAQTSGASLGTPFPYEVLAGTAADDPWKARAVRTPGFRVLVPNDLVRKLPAKPPKGFDAARVGGGLLFRSSAKTPFAMRSLGPLEEHLLALFD